MKQCNTKNILAVLLLCILLFTVWVLPVSAASPRLSDGSGLLNAEEASVLSEKLDSLSLALSHDIAIATVESLNGKSSQSYADELYDAMGYGFGESESGILLLVCLNCREYALSAKGEAADLFDAFAMTSLENAFVSLLSSGDYAAAFHAYADTCEEILRAEGRMPTAWIGISLVLGGVIAGAVLWAMISRHKNVKPRRTADSYMRRDTFRLTHSRDVYLYAHVTRVAKPKNNSSGGSRGGSRGGGGRSGRSGRF